MIHYPPFGNSDDGKRQDRATAVGMYLLELVVAMDDMDEMFGEGSKERFYDNLADNVSGNLAGTAGQISDDAKLGMMLLHGMVGEAIFSQPHLEAFPSRLLAYYKGEGWLAPNNGRLQVRGI